MNIFTLDVGTGTQDFFLYNSEENLRNCIKMVLPSPTKLVARKVKECTLNGQDIFFSGYTMGGGPVTRAAMDHLRAGLNVYAQEKAALTFSDNLDKVRNTGVQLVDSVADLDAHEIELKDVDLHFFRHLLDELNDRADIYLIAVQDHGFSPHESNRKFRFKTFKKIVEQSGYIHSFLFPSSQVPSDFNRMSSVTESLKNEGVDIKDVFLMDTVFAAIAGCMLDVKEFPALLINFGNSHTVGAVVDNDGLIHSLFEHHTRILREKGEDGIESFINSFIKGEISNKDVFNDGGHGAYIRDVVEVKDSAITGPNMHLSSRRPANPTGDVMITGNLGLVHSYLGDKLDLNFS
ncbi:MAG: DUF1786 domain-containing protein [Archaeoglobaceae archaeon]